MTNVSDGKRDFFVSFSQADRTWATWIAWMLEEKGYSVFFQDWDFKRNFVLEMDRAHTHSPRTRRPLARLPSLALHRSRVGGALRPACNEPPPSPKSRCGARASFSASSASPSRSHLTTSTML